MDAAAQWLADLRGNLPNQAAVASARQAAVAGNRPLPPLAACELEALRKTPPRLSPPIGE